MTMSRARRRWTRRAIAFLIVLNTAIWASHLSRGHSRAVSHGASAGRPGASSTR